ncbi:MAG TPA: GNAT family N-acetyltransferase [Allosphingosinicella sp.]|nr:GNAT family N-acetyltransferase [Allosphingosinicella sp.]
MPERVVNNEAEGQYELKVEGATALAAYRLKDDRISFTHTQVPPELEGRGIGTRLIKGALDDVRTRGLRVVPICSFVRHYMESHDEVRDLLA